jgi:hypothetical protein
LPNEQILHRFSALKQQQAIEALATNNPALKCIVRGHLDQHRHAPFGRRKITRPKRHGTHGLRQGVAAGYRMISRVSLMQRALGHAPGLVRKSLQPEDACEQRMRGNALINQEARSRR